MRKVSPSHGGCWVCERIEGNLQFDIEFDTFYHPQCLEEYDCESVLEYERSAPHE